MTRHVFWPPVNELTQTHIDDHAFWPSNEMDFLCVHHYLATDMMTEIERLRKEVERLGKELERATEWDW